MVHVLETQALVAGRGQRHQLVNLPQRVAKLTPRINVWN